ncbi:unnamed protein product [Moneuplotes crassus]|uniref:Cyclic nucleotide-binding domain-containing protein n=1 Tax=Euplotes crassus TaxID=5936 RepID=A0AAD1XB09_EUPCR|nr:unnamed protein product [Moneuplotes crassus]
MDQSSSQPDLKMLRRFSQLTKLTKLQPNKSPRKNNVKEHFQNALKKLKEGNSSYKKGFKKRSNTKPRDLLSSLTDKIFDGSIYKLSFNEVIFILKKESEDRQKFEINGMQRFFKDNKFFKDLELTEGEDTVKKCFQRLKYACYEEGEYIMRQGDDGDKYYIILEGEVQILINKQITQEFSCMELLTLVIQNYEFIIQNHEKHEILKELKYYFKHLIKVDLKGKLCIKNLEKAQRYLETSDRIVHFTRTNAYGIKECIKKQFTYTIMKEVSRMSDGGSVGEYALLHGKKRSATVRALKKTHFATMDKNDFEEVMYSIKKKEIDQVVSFLDGYEFIKNLTYTTKAKLGYRLKNKSYSLGQEVFYEGSNDSNVYFIESGQFVITKALYIRKDSGKTIIDFRRAYSGKPFNVLKSTFNEETVCLFTDNIDDQPLNKNKESEYFDLKISIRTSGGMFGLTERFLGCPYRIMSIKCISKQGCLKYVDSDSLLDSCKSLDSSIFGAILAKKFSLTYQGIQNFCKWKKAEINQSYYKVPLLSQLQSEKMRKVRTFSVTQNSYKKEKEESYFNNLSEESPIKTQRKRKATIDNDISNGDSGSPKSDRSNSYANARNSPREQKFFQKFTMARLCLTL